MPARCLRPSAHFGAPLSNVAVSDFAREGCIYQMGRPPARVDVLTSIEGVRFADAWRNRVATDFGGVPAHVISPGPAHQQANLGPSPRSARRQQSAGSREDAGKAPGTSKAEEGQTAQDVTRERRPEPIRPSRMRSQSRPAKTEGAAIRGRHARVAGPHFAAFGSASGTPGPRALPGSLPRLPQMASV